MHEWLTEVLFAGLNHVGGLAIIVVTLSVVTWLGLLAILRRAQLRKPGHIAAGLGLLLATIAGYPVWGPRAQMITFALTGLLLFLWERNLPEGARPTWPLVPISLVGATLPSD